MDEEDLLYFNGLNGESGDYALAPMTQQGLSAAILGQEPPPNLRDLQTRRAQETDEVRGVKEGVNPEVLGEAGWGLVFAHNADPAVRDALQELIDHRRDLTGGEHYQIYAGERGVQANESKSEWLSRHGMGPGPADPEKVPYYLLLVGSPEEIPYRFQSQLDVQYAVGRIHFETLDEYASYARSVVEAEKGRVRLPRQMAFFAPANPDDRATALSARHLVEELKGELETGDDYADWSFSAVMRDEARKERLVRLLGGEQTPALLFTATHGVSFPVGSPRQLPDQGALVCQEWPGPKKWRKTIPQDFYLAGGDLGQATNLLGLIAFFFACFGAGTPLRDEFTRQTMSGQRTIAPYPFLARLPQKMLGHPRGGALAVIGHVERAWGYSFIWPGAGGQTEVFRSAISRLLKGQPVGLALEYFNQRHAELSVELNDLLEKVDFGLSAEPEQLARLWTANNDARGYAIIGDPAVRLPLVRDGDEEPARPVIELRLAAETAATGGPETAEALPAAAEAGPEAAEALPAAPDAGPSLSVTTNFGPDTVTVETRRENDVLARTAVTLAAGDEPEQLDEVEAAEARFAALHRAAVAAAIAAWSAYQAANDS
jgi:hypothetical protein